MRKSSLHNRSSNILANDRRSRGRSTDGPRSSLLQPGFATKHRRSSSAENRDSGVGLLQPRSHLPIRRSRSQLSVQSCLTPVTFRRETISPCSSRTTPRDGKAKYNSAAHSQIQLRSGMGVSQKPRRDVRNFSDKAVLSAAISQVSSYFSRHGMTLNLRQPPSLKLFVEATAFLLNEVGIPVDLTTSNYMEEIPCAMRLLGYPGSLASSWLKTAYAQHSLQHLVAMLSWVVDLIENTKVTDFFNDSESRVLPAKDYFEFFTDIHTKWNQFEPEEGVIDAFKKRIAQTMLPDVDENRITTLEEEIESLSAKCRQIDQVSKQEKVLEQNLQALQSEIFKSKTRQKNTHKYCATIDIKIQSLEARKAEAEGKIIQVQCHTEKLRKQVAHQEMSVDEMNELLQTCEHLRGRIRSAEKCSSELQEMAYKCDRLIVQTRAKFNEKMEYFNNLLVMESCSIPQLSELQIKSNVLADGYKAEADDVNRALSSLHKDLVSARIETEKVLSDLKRKLDEMTQSGTSVLEEITSLTEKNLLLEERISKLKISIQETETKTREEEKRLKDEIAKSLSNQDTAALENELSALEAKQEKWKVALHKLKDKASRFFKESVVITDSFAAEARNLRAQHEERLNKLIEQKKAQHCKRP